jgi:hypothetical protein
MSTCTARLDYNRRGGAREKILIRKTRIVATALGGGQWSYDPLYGYWV